MTITLYGLPNCDSVKKARRWLDERGTAFTFHDFRKDGVPADRLAAWVAAVGWARLLNRQGTTWRRLDEPTRAGVVDVASATALMRAQPSVIKRPVIEWGRKVTVGYEPADWPAG